MIPTSESTCLATRDCYKVGWQLSGGVPVLACVVWVTVFQLMFCCYTCLSGCPTGECAAGAVPHASCRRQGLRADEVVVTPVTTFCYHEVTGVNGGSGGNDSDISDSTIFRVCNSYV